MAKNIEEVTVKVNVKISWGNIFKLLLLKRILPIGKYSIEDLIANQKHDDGIDQNA